jgi:Sec7-like guanine-nucleotide exchange factor
MLMTLCSGRINKAALRHYMTNFDFSGLRLDVAFRCDSRAFDSVYAN